MFESPTAHTCALALRWRASKDGSPSTRCLSPVIFLPVNAAVRLVQDRSHQFRPISPCFAESALNGPNAKATFSYVGGNEDEAEATKDAAMSAPTSDLTIAEAKAGLAATFGVDPSQIEITIKGYFSTTSGNITDDVIMNYLERHTAPSKPGFSPAP